MSLPVTVALPELGVGTGFPPLTVEPCWQADNKKTKQKTKAKKGFIFMFLQQWKKIMDNSFYHDSLRPIFNFD